MDDKVGLGRGQTQQAQYFGPDCSMLHCPTGDDPGKPDKSRGWMGESNGRRSRPSDFVRRCVSLVVTREPTP